MTLSVLVLALLAVQLLLVLLDAWEALATRGTVRLTTVMFLGVVALLYGAIQLGGLRLIPEPSRLLDYARTLLFAPNAHGHPQTLSGPDMLLVGVFLFYLAGLWDYLIHRFLSHHRWLWFTHEYHHLPRHLSILMPGIAASPFAFLPRALTLLVTGLSAYAAFALVGLPLWDLRPVAPVLLVVMTVGLASHSAWLRRYEAVHRTLRRLALTTPQEHLLHHTTRMNGNYGNFTTLWDRVFGTYLDPRSAPAGVRLGLPYDQDFLGTLTFGLVKIPDRWRARFEVGRFCNLEFDAGTWGPDTYKSSGAVSRSAS